MKKGLLGSTAIVAATVVAAGAASAEAPTANFSGFVNFQAYIPDNDLSAADARAIYFGVDDAELIVRATGTTDSGLRYGLKIEFEGSQSSNSVSDEARISIGGSFGTILAGDDDGADDALAVGGESLMGATGGIDGDQDDWYDNVAGGFATGRTGPDDIDGNTGDATKITYFSNDFSGFKFGVSFTPQNSVGDGGTTPAGNFENFITGGAQYSTNFGRTGLQVGATYATASNTAGAADLSSYHVGGVVTFGAFGVAGSYADNGDANATFWDVSASYSNGPAAVAIGYFSSEADTAPGTDQRTHLALTADYNLAQGLGVYGEYNSISEDNGAGGTSNDGSVILLGVQVNF